MLTTILKGFVFFKNNIKIIAVIAAIAAAFFYFQSAKKEAYENGYAAATKQAEENMQKAISELSNDAEKARFGRVSCRASGGMWSFANNECVKG